MQYFFVLLLVALLSACFHDENSDPIPGGGFLEDYSGDTDKSDKLREQLPQIVTAELNAQIENNTEFTLALYENLTNSAEFQNKNIVFSPFSISLTTAMLTAGAANNTLDEINQVLKFNTDQTKLHEIFNSLDLAYASRAGSFPRADQSMGEVQLNINNALWGQVGYSFETSFMDVLAVNYGAGMNLLDFASDPQQARTEINQWVSAQTRDKITEAMPEDSIDSNTRLVFTNTVYFKADWQKPFSAPSTSNANFGLLDGTSVTIPLMNQDASFSYSQAGGVTAVEMPLVGKALAMLIIMPDAGSFSAYESAFDRLEMQSIVTAMRTSRIFLSVPKFDFKTEVPLKTELVALGVIDAFEENVADFSAMDGSKKLFVQSAVHKAFITVEESGVEAGAFTGFSVGVTSVPPSIVINQPFLFMIRDTTNNSILFFGRFVNPA